MTKPTTVITLRCLTETKEKIESLVPNKYISTSEFVLRAIIEKLNKEGV